MLESTYLPQNHCWPRPAGDFGRIWPTPDLVLRREDARGSVWTNGWTGNAVGLGLALVTSALLAALWVWREPLLTAYAEGSVLVKLVSWLFLVGIVLATKLGLVMACFRSKLVIDEAKGEVRVSAWGRLHEALSLDAIRLVSLETIWRVSGSDDEHLWQAQPALVMELHDGTLIRVTTTTPSMMGRLLERLISACGGAPPHDPAWETIEVPCQTPQLAD